MVFVPFGKDSNMIKTLEELNAVKEQTSEVVKTRILSENSGKRDVLVCGGTGCTSSGSAKIIKKLH